MAFKRGHPKHGGRKRGTPNKASLWVRELAQAIIGDPRYLKTLRKRLRELDQPLPIEGLIWKYAGGLPLDPNRVSQNHPDEEDLVEETAGEDDSEEGDDEVNEDADEEDEK